MSAVMKTKHSPIFLLVDTCSFSRIGSGNTNMYTSDMTLIIPMTTKGT